jgi:hypothetical protein
MKIVVFDLDETMGYFTEYGIFWDCLIKYLTFKNKNKLTQHDFNNTLDLFPEFLRPNIITILTYLKSRKNSKCCNKMMIYTNNTGPSEWAHHIIGYFESKIKFKLIDQIIAAFKVNGKRVEICRTSHNKTHKDFIRCTKIPLNAEICFLDDTFYPEMANDNIYYINIEPYYHDLNFNYMISTFRNSKEGEKLLGNNALDFDDLMLKEFKKYNYTVREKNSKEYEIDNVLGKQIIVHLQDFFNKSKKNKTYKNMMLYKKNKTQKNKK